jgi:hypothetical protein
MRKELTVVLSYPSVSSVWHLPVGIGYLAGVLSSRGHRVEKDYGYVKALEYVFRRYGGRGIENALSLVRSPNSTITERYRKEHVFYDYSRT